MNTPSLAVLGLLRRSEAGGIAVSPGWTCEHDVLVDWSLADLVAEDEDDAEEGSLEIVFEPDFSLDDDGDDEEDEEGRGLFVLFEPDDDDEEEEEDDGWPR